MTQPNNNTEPCLLCDHCDPRIDNKTCRIEPENCYCSNVEKQRNPITGEWENLEKCSDVRGMEDCDFSSDQFQSHYWNAKMNALYLELNPMSLPDGFDFDEKSFSSKIKRSLSEVDNSATLFAISSGIIIMCFLFVSGLWLALNLGNPFGIGSAIVFVVMLIIGFFLLRAFKNYVKDEVNSEDEIRMNYKNNENVLSDCLKFVNGTRKDFLSLNNVA